MSSILIPRVLTSQPQSCVQINWAHPLTSGLRYAIIATQSGPMDVVSGRFFTPFNTPTIAVCRDGIAARASEPNQAWELPISGELPASLTEFSLYWRGARYAPTVVGGVLTVSSGSDSSLPPYVSMSLKAGGSLPDTVFLSYNANGSYASVVPVCDVDPEPEIEVLLGRYRAGYAANIFAGVPGRWGRFNIVIPSGTATLSYAGQRIIVGEDYRLSSRNPGRAMSLGLVYTNFLIDQQVNALRDNPWQIFKSGE